MLFAVLASVRNVC